jgi:aryl-alcohol dehydrogenase-like predicted oxidoreductase
MRFKLFGRTGLRVSELCLGCMTFGEDWGWGADREESLKIWLAFIDAGGNFVDTANNYTNGTSESLVAEFAAASRQKLVIATKYSLTTDPADPNSGGNHRKSLVQSIERSLMRLRTDYIDLLWLHLWDFMTPVDEVMRALDDVVRMGKVLYVGISDTPAWIISRSNMLAELRGWTPFAGIQIEYSLAQRDAERDLLPMAAALGLQALAWSPLKNGVLSGKYNSGRDNGERVAGGRLSEGSRSRNQVSERDLAVAQQVIEMAAEIGRSPAQVALAWIRQQSPILIPIIGCRRLGQFADNLGCLELELSAEHLKKLDELSRPELGFPHDFIGAEFARAMVNGDVRDRIDLSSCRRERRF